MQSRGILVSDKSKSYALCEIDDPRSDLRPGFHTSGKSQMIGMSTISCFHKSAKSGKTAKSPIVWDCPVI